MVGEVARECGLRPPSGQRGPKGRIVQAANAALAGQDA